MGETPFVDVQDVEGNFVRTDLNFEMHDFII